MLDNLVCDPFNDIANILKFTFKIYLRYYVIENVFILFNILKKPDISRHKNSPRNTPSS